MKDNLGSGSIKKLLLQLAIPTVVAQVVNLLYNIVDRIFIGHIEGAGPSALTGVGLFAPILMLITAFANLIGSGGAPKAAIAMGQKKDEHAERILGNSFSLLIIIGLCLTLIFEMSAARLLTLFGASDATLPYALGYARIYIAGCVIVLLQVGMNVFISCQGFTRISMMTTLIGAIMNIILDALFIYGFHLGVRGAAMATVISQSIGCLWILKFLTGSRTKLRLRRENIGLDPKVFLPCLALGCSTFVMTSTEGILSMSFTSSLHRYGGDIAVGAMTILASINNMLFLPLSGICMGAQPLISYNFGAGKKDRVKEAFRTELTVCVMIGFILWACVMLFSRQIAGIFTSDTELIEYSSWAVHIYQCVAFIFPLQICCQQSFMALSQAKVSLLLACLRKLVLLIPLIFILPHFFADQVFAVFLAEPVSDFIAATVTFITFLSRFNRILERGAR